MATVRAIVADVEAATQFYVDGLGFEVERHFGSAVAILSRDDVALWLSGPTSSAARPMPDGRIPEPGGWTRLVLEVEDLDARVAELRAAGVSFRNEIVSGPGGRQIVLDDPSGNAVELFEPRA